MRVIACFCISIISGCASLTINVRDFSHGGNTANVSSVSSDALSRAEQTVFVRNFSATVIVVGFLNTSPDADKKDSNFERQNAPLTKYLVPAVHYDIVEDRRAQGNRPIKMGTGVIIEASDDRAFILTNDHVQKNTDKLTAVLYDGREYPARVVWASNDSAFDVAFLEIKKRDPADPEETFVAAKLGDSDFAAAGDHYMMIGHPFGLYYSAHIGNLAQIRSSFFADNDTILQLNMNTYPGNSGSMIVNARGFVDGLVFATRRDKDSGWFAAIGWAIPINPVKEKFKEIQREMQEKNK